MPLFKKSLLWWVRKDSRECELSEETDSTDGSGAIWRAVAPALRWSIALGMATFHLQDSTVDISKATAPFQLNPVTVLYASALCGLSSGALVYCVINQNHEMEQWRQGNMKGSLWWRGPSPIWLPLLQFKMNVHFASYLLLMPVVQLMALYAQPHVAALLRDASALAKRCSGVVAVAISHATSRRLNLQLWTCLIVTLVARCATMLVVYQIAPILSVVLVLCGVLVSLVKDVVYVQFDAFAFFIQMTIHHANERLRVWIKEKPPSAEKSDMSSLPLHVDGNAGPSAGAVRAMATLLERAAAAARRLNSIYSPQLMAIVLNLYINIVCTMYYLTLRLITDIRKIFPNAMSEFLSALWLLQCSVMLFLVVRSCEAVTHEAKKTSILVHELLLTCDDPEVRYELQLLSVQLLHRRVQFSACGFFPFDYSLLYSIVGAVTTYIIILIQIQLSLVSNKQK